MPMCQTSAIVDLLTAEQYEMLHLITIDLIVPIACNSEDVWDLIKAGETEISAGWVTSLDVEC